MNFDITETADNICFVKWCSQSRNVKANASTLKSKVWAFDAKATGPEANVFKHTATEETYGHRRN